MVTATQTTNHYGVWVSSDSAVVGVLNCNSVEYIWEEVDYGDGAVDLTYQDALLSYLAEKTATWQSKIAYDATPSTGLLEKWESRFNYDDNGESVHLIGSWLKDAQGQYVPDETGEYAAIVDCGSNTIQIIWSKFATRGALCSPCYPGQVDLDSEGEFLGFDLPMDLYGSSRENSNSQIEIASL